MLREDTVPVGHPTPMLEAIASGRSIYGATTGFGPLVS